MKEFILDTSVVLKWFSEFGEEDMDQALQLRQALLRGSALFIVPELLFYELSNALRYNPHFSSEDVQEAVNSAFDMGLNIRGVDKKVIGDAVSLAYKYNVTVYDAYFLALCRTERKPLIIADYKLFKKIKGFKEIIKLSDMTL